MKLKEMDKKDKVICLRGDNCTAPMCGCYLEQIKKDNGKTTSSQGGN